MLFKQIYEQSEGIRHELSGNVYLAVRLTNHKDLCLVYSGLSKKLTVGKWQETQLRIRGRSRKG